LIKHAWLESGGVYGHRNITLDLKDLDDPCSKNRVYRLMKAEGIRAQRVYKRNKGYSGGKPAHVPISGSTQGFAISPNSHQAVSTVHGGERFTIVYSFFSEAR